MFKCLRRATIRDLVAQAAKAEMWLKKKLYIIKRNYENEFGRSTAAEQSFER